jgi:hypothetical protein
MAAPLIFISLTIGKNNYKLKIPAERESQIRAAVTDFNKIIENYTSNFPGQKEHDYLAMAFIAFVAEQNNNNEVSSNILESLKAIENQL